MATLRLHFSPVEYCHNLVALSISLVVLFPLFFTMDAEPSVPPDGFVLLVADTVIESCKHWYFRRMMTEPDPANKVKYMKRLIGKGATGCCHRSFTAEPAIVEEEVLNPRSSYKVVAKGISIKLFTIEHPRDYANPDIKKSDRQRDNRFEYGSFYGDAPWFFEMYLKYIVTAKHVALEDLGVVKFGEPLVVPDEVLRKNFVPFWEHFLSKFGLGLDDVPPPDWVLE